MGGRGEGAGQPGVGNRAPAHLPSSPSPRFTIAFVQQTFEPGGISSNMEFEGLLELAWGPPKGRVEIKVQGSPLLGSNTDAPKPACCLEDLAIMLVNLPIAK